MDNKEPSNFDQLAAKLVQLAENTTASPAEQDRLLQRPVDIVCFGRSGVGKSTLLGAITGHDLGATSRLDHGTQRLTGVEYRQSVPVGEGTKELPIRFWDTKGIDEWNESNLALLFEELEANNVKPICVIYCAAASGRVNTKVVETVLQHFYTREVLLFYAVTNMYAGTGNQIDTQIEEGCDILKRITGSPPQPRTTPGLITDTTVDDVFSFGADDAGKKKVHLLAINSVQFENKRSGSNKKPKNVDVLMQLCVENLDEERLVQYFLATLHNRDFWAQATDKVKDVLHYLAKNYRVAVNNFSDWLRGVTDWLSEVVPDLMKHLQ